MPKCSRLTCLQECTESAAEWCCVYSHLICGQSVKWKWRSSCMKPAFLQLTPERHQWCLTGVLTSADKACCTVLVLFQSLSYMILGETLWNLTGCFGSSVWHVPGRVQCIQDTEGFCCAPVYLNLGSKVISSKIVWGEIFVDEAFSENCC